MAMSVMSSSSGALLEATLEADEPPSPLFPPSNSRRAGASTSRASSTPTGSTPNGRGSPRPLQSQRKAATSRPHPPRTARQRRLARRISPCRLGGPAAAGLTLQRAPEATGPGCALPLIPQAFFTSQTIHIMLGVRRLRTPSCFPAAVVWQVWKAVHHVSTVSCQGCPAGSGNGCPPPPAPTLPLCCPPGTDVCVRPADCQSRIVCLDPHQFDPPEAPPSTYYEPRLPYAPTISQKAKPRPSERPGTPITSQAIGKTLSLHRSPVAPAISVCPVSPPFVLFLPVVGSKSRIEGLRSSSPRMRVSDAPVLLPLSCRHPRRPLSRVVEWDAAVYVRPPPSTLHQCRLPHSSCPAMLEYSALRTRSGDSPIRSRSLRQFQDPPSDHSSSRSTTHQESQAKQSEAPVSAWLRTPSTVAGATAGTRLAVGNLLHVKQLREKNEGLLMAGDPRADSPGPNARIDNLLTNWGAPEPTRRDLQRSVDRRTPPYRGHHRQVARPHVVIALGGVPQVLSMPSRRMFITPCSRCKPSMG